jgi:hypothetical protein
MHLDFALPVDGDLEVGIKRHDQKAELAVMDYSYHVPITEWTEKVWIFTPNMTPGFLTLLFATNQPYMGSVSIAYKDAVDLPHDASTFAYDAVFIVQAAKLARKGLTSPPAVKAQLVAITYVQLYVRCKVMR